MPEETRPASLHLELAELYRRARRAINEARDLAADREFILWWHRMRPRYKRRPAPMMED